MRCLILFLALILPLPAFADFEADRAIEAARFANIMAAHSVTQIGLDNIEKIIREKQKTYV